MRWISWFDCVKEGMTLNSMQLAQPLVHFTFTPQEHLRALAWQGNAMISHNSIYF